MPFGNKRIVQYANLISYGNDYSRKYHSRSALFAVAVPQLPTIADASTEIINLEAILNLPKGTCKHFLTDIHGEYEAFQHVLKNASGSIKRKVNEIFGHTLRESEKKELCTLIYYPEEKLQLVKETETDLEDWYQITLNQLVKVCQKRISKYTRSKVRKALPKEFSYIIQELLHESSIEPNKLAYINVIVSTINFYASGPTTSSLPCATSYNV